MVVKAKLVVANLLCFLVWISDTAAISFYILWYKLDPSGKKYNELMSVVENWQAVHLHLQQQGQMVTPQCFSSAAKNLLDIHSCKLKVWDGTWYIKK